MLTIDGMEVWGRVISPEHSDNDAVEATELRHEVARGGALEITPRESCLLV